MGDVTLAVLQGPSGFSKLQVIKRLRIEIADNSEFVEMFLHEARIAARLSHPNIVQTNEVGQDGDIFFIAMEYLEGQTLHAILRQSRRKESLDPLVASTGAGAHISDPTPLSGNLAPGIPTHTPQAERALPVAIGLRIVSDALEGLHYAHELTDESGTPMELVHRDFSPGNVFVTYDGNVKVLDFGIAKAADSHVYTRTGIIKGKVPYMAPEQFRSRTINRRCDLYAVGAVLWEIAAGVRLWHGLSDLEIITRLSSTGIPSPRTVNPLVHPRLEQICMRALSLNPNERYATAAEIQADIDAVLREIGGASGRAVSKYVGSLFAQKRAQQQAIIESKLRELRQQSGSGLHNLSVEMSAPWTVSRPSASSSSTNSAVNSAVASGAVRFGQVVQTTSGVTTPNPPSTSQRSLGWIIALGSLAVIGLAIGGAYWVTRMNQPQTLGGPPPSSNVADPTPGPSAPPPMPRTRLVVQASPADAQLFLDDAPLMINPYSGEVPQDGRVHYIRGEAKGFVSQTQPVTLSGPTAVINLRLERGTRRRDGGK
ncbi:protein kinase [Pendulispora albinea]|uniref:Protein kinase n=2 Tax=Pendulispora albinea TaxID=2741071 RepID=A0ABZ2M6D1_9BACT